MPSYVIDNLFNEKESPAVKQYNKAEVNNAIINE